MATETGQQKFVTTCGTNRGARIRTMAEINKTANGNRPVTRRECGLLHDTLATEVHVAMRHLKWFIGGAVSILTTLVILAVGLIQSTMPTENPPLWFQKQVDRMQVSIDHLENDLHKHVYEEAQ